MSETAIVTGAAGGNISVVFMAANVSVCTDSMNLTSFVVEGIVSMRNNYCSNRSLQSSVRTVGALFT